jgi:CheY-like chemotaxis protein
MPECYKHEGQTMTVLIVEYHADTLSAMRRLLEGSGHVVLTACTVAEARQICDTTKFDVLLSEIRLCDGEAFALAAEAKKRGARAIAITGHGTPQDVAQSLAAGFEIHLTKPVDYELVNDIIKGRTQGQ